MSVDNLPALRTSTSLAVTAAPEASPAPTVYPQSGNYFLLAMTGGILAGSAAWGQLWAVALGVGAGSVALGVAGVWNRRRERPAMSRVGMSAPDNTTHRRALTSGNIS